MTNPTYHRTNLNLYVEDVEYMQRVYGRGWTEQARDIIHQELKQIKKRMAPTIVGNGYRGDERLLNDMFGDDD